MPRFLLIALCACAGFLPAYATTVRPPEFAELVHGADYVVRARVREVAYETRVRGGREALFTKVSLDVIEVISGNPPQPLVLEMLGGKRGDEEMIVHGAPRFAVGDEDILFVRGNGRNFSPLVAVMHGRYPVRRDPTTGAEFVTRSNGVPLSDLAEVSLPVVEGAAARMQHQMRRAQDAFSPAEFSQLIRATKSAAKGGATSKAK